MYPSILSGLLSWGLISHMCKISDWGQEWLWTREAQWTQTLDLGLISNRIKPIELIVYRHSALNNLHSREDSLRVRKSVSWYSAVNKWKGRSKANTCPFRPSRQSALCHRRVNSKTSTLLVILQARKRAAGASKDLLCACVGFWVVFFFQMQFRYF